jgi:hypothetical protein
LKRVTINDKTYIIGYHTQEYRSKILDQPIICNAKNAWLGKGYYFWVDLKFAHYWGKDFKKSKTNYYDIYQADLNTENCVDAVFDEKGYNFFCEIIDKAIKYLESAGLTTNLELVNRFLLDNFWNKMGVTGVIYDDLPVNRDDKDRMFSKISFREGGRDKYFYYKKRIQIVIFDLKNIHNFELLLEEQE